MNESRDDGKLLLHAVRISGNRLCKILRKSKEISIFPNSLFSLFLGNAEYIGNKIEVLHTAEEFIQIRIIRQIGNLAFTADGIRFYGNTIYIDLPLLKLQYPATGFDGRGLACAVMSDKAIDLPRPNMQGKIINGFFLAV